MNLYLETERLIMRDIEESDLHGMFELDSDPEVHQFLGNNPITTLDQAAESINYIRTQYKQNGIGRCAVVEKSTNEFVGWSGIKLEDIVRPEFKYYDLGYRLKKKFWGKGYASESALASMKYGFNELNLPEICGAADVNNVASNKILTKAGLEWKDTFYFENEKHNWYTIKQEDWKRKNQ